MTEEKTKDLNQDAPVEEDAYTLPEGAQSTFIMVGITAFLVLCGSIAAYGVWGERITTGLALVLGDAGPRLGQTRARGADTGEHPHVMKIVVLKHRHPRFVVMENFTPSTDTVIRLSLVLVAFRLFQSVPSI